MEDGGWMLEKEVILIWDGPMCVCLFYFVWLYFCRLDNMCWLCRV